MSKSGKSFHSQSYLRDCQLTLAETTLPMLHEDETCVVKEQNVMCDVGMHENITYKSCDLSAELCGTETAPTEEWFCDATVEMSANKTTRDITTALCEASNCIDTGTWLMVNYDEVPVDWTEITVLDERKDDDDDTLSERILDDRNDFPPHEQHIVGLEIPIENIVGEQLESHITVGQDYNYNNERNLLFGCSKDESVQCLGVFCEEKTEDHTYAKSPISGKPCSPLKDDEAERAADEFEQSEAIDLNDPKWEDLRNLKTDEERYQALRNRWGNQTVPNPQKLLTEQNFRRRNLAQETSDPDVNRRLMLKRRASPSFVRGPRPTKRLCTLYDEMIMNSQESCCREIGEINGQEMQSLLEIEMQKQNEVSGIVACYGPYFLGNYFGDITYRSHQAAQCVGFYFESQRRAVWEKNEDLVNRLKEAKSELYTFNKFYQVNADVVLSADDLKAFEEQERMYEMYDTLYTL